MTFHRAMFAFVALAISLVATIATLSKPVAAKPEFAQIQYETRTDAVVAHSLTLVDEDGRECIRMIGMKGGGGLWIGSSESEKIVSIYTLPGQGPVIGLTNKSKKAANVCPLALSLDADGKPLIQFEGKDGKLHWLSADDLEKVAK